MGGVVEFGPEGSDPRLMVPHGLGFIFAAEDVGGAVFNVFVSGASKVAVYPDREAVLIYHEHGNLTKVDRDLVLAGVLRKDGFLKRRNLVEFDLAEIKFGDKLVLAAQEDQDREQIKPLRVLGRYQSFRQEEGYPELA